MSLLKWRVFKLVLLLAVAATMLSVTRAQTPMTEIPLGGAGGGGGAQGFTGGTVEGDLGGGGELAGGCAPR